MPTELALHRLSKVLAVSFDDGSSYRLPAEYLRVFSPSAEVMGHGPGQRKVPIGKEAVNIDRVEPVGNYAVALHFDDGHNTGIYSWETLYKLGANFDTLWQQYLGELVEAGYKRKAGDG
jgi:DUF971 family protein